MLNAFITGSLYWLAVGSFLWMIFDPARLTDFIEHKYIRKYDRLPSKWLLYVAHVGAIVAAPLFVLIVLRKLHRRVWG